MENLIIKYADQVFDFAIKLMGLLSLQARTIRTAFLDKSFTSYFSVVGTLLIAATIFFCFSEIGTVTFVQSLIVAFALILLSTIVIYLSATITVLAFSKKLKSALLWRASIISAYVNSTICMLAMLYQNGASWIYSNFYQRYGELPIFGHDGHRIITVSVVIFLGIYSTLFFWKSFVLFAELHSVRSSQRFFFVMIAFIVSLVVTSLSAPLIAICFDLVGMTGQQLFDGVNFFLYGF